MRQWDVKKEAALSRITEQRMNKEAVEAENAANNAKLAEHLVHVSTYRLVYLKSPQIHDGCAALAGISVSSCLRCCNTAGHSQSEQTGAWPCTGLPVPQGIPWKQVSCQLPILQETGL